MSRSYDLMKGIQHTEERLDEEEYNLLSLLNELEEALTEEGRRDEWLSHWKKYRDRQYENMYGEPYEDEEEKEDND